MLLLLLVVGVHEYGHYLAARLTGVGIKRLSVGSSIGISVMSTLISRETQINWNQMRHHLSPFNPTLKQLLETHQLQIDSPLTVQLLAQKLTQHASFNAYIDSFMLAATGFLLLLPFLFFIDGKTTSQPIDALH